MDWMGLRAHGRRPGQGCEVSRQPWLMHSKHMLGKDNGGVGVLLLWVVVRGGKAYLVTGWGRLD